MFLKQPGQDVIEVRKLIPKEPDGNGRTSSVLLASMDISERHNLLIVSAGLHPPFLPAHADDNMAVSCLQCQKKMQQSCPEHP